MQTRRRNNKGVGIYSEDGKMDVLLFLTPENRFSANILGHRLDADSAQGLTALVKDALSGFSVDYVRLIEYYQPLPFMADHGVDISVARLYLGLVTLAGVENPIVCSMEWDWCELNQDNNQRLKGADVFPYQVQLPFSFPVKLMGDDDIHVLLEYTDSRWDTLFEIANSLDGIRRRLSTFNDADWDKVKKVLSPFK